MSNPQSSPYTRQVPKLRLVGTDGVGADALEPVTMTAPIDARDIAREVGRNGVAIYGVVRANDLDGVPNTYQTIADTLAYSVRQVIRVVQKMEACGFVSLEKGGGRQLPTTITSVDKTMTLGVTLGVTSTTNSDTDGIDKTVTLGVTSPPIPPVSQLVSLNQQTDRQAARPDAEPELTVINPNESAWLPLLGDRVGKLERKLGRMSNEFTGGLVRSMLLHAEARLGPVPEEPLIAGIQAGITALERQLKAEQSGGKPIRNLGRYGSKIIADKIAEVMA